MSNRAPSVNRYQSLIEKIFFDAYRDTTTEIHFRRDDLITAAQHLSYELPKNIGDVIYAIRYRIGMPQSILATQSIGKEWIIEGTGRAAYVFRLVPINRIVPNASLIVIKVPNATPEIITAHSLSDEQALLAKVRYNRLVDIFVGMATYSLQNHLRTTVRGVGQIEIDEVYVGIDRGGRQFVFPVQAKGGSDQLGVVQTRQDIACCAEKFPHLICRPIAAQFMEDDLIALFEMAVEGDQVRIVDEKHYRLVLANSISADDLRGYGHRNQ